MHAPFPIFWCLGASPELPGAVDGGTAAPLLPPPLPPRSFPSFPSSSSSLFPVFLLPLALFPSLFLFRFLYLHPLLPPHFFHSVFLLPLPPCSSPSLFTLPLAFSLPPSLFLLPLPSSSSPSSSSALLVSMLSFISFFIEPRTKLFLVLDTFGCIQTLCQHQSMANPLTPFPRLLTRPFPLSPAMGGPWCCPGHPHPHPWDWNTPLTSPPQGADLGHFEAILEHTEAMLEHFEAVLVHFEGVLGLWLLRRFRTLLSALPRGRGWPLRSFPTQTSPQLCGS